MTATAVAVRERGILMSGPMVRATLDGRKTQTRRVVTDANSQGNYPASCLLLDDPRTFVDPGPSPAGNVGPYLHAPVNAPAVEQRYGWQPGDCDPTVVERLYPRYAVGDRLWVREAWRTHADGKPYYEADEGYSDEDTGEPHPDGPFAGSREAYAALWDSLNAKRGYSWDSDPWVWVLSFRTVTP
jgi:hypothetical protein